MNLQELNQSGKSLRVFLLTGFLLFIGAVTAWKIAVVVKQAQANFTQRRHLLSHSFWLQSLDLRKAQWKYLASQPRLLKTVAEKGFLMGMFTRGRYDPKAFRYINEMILERGIPSPDPWAPGRFKQEIKYLLGINRLPENEDYGHVWRVRGESWFEDCHKLQLSGE